LRELLQAGTDRWLWYRHASDTSADAPYLDCAYKLVEYAGHPRASARRKGDLARSQTGVSRYDDQGQCMQADIITIEDDVPQGEPLIQAVMKGGQRLQPAEPLAKSRERAARQLAQLPGHLRALGTTPPFPVTISPALEALARQADREVTS
jgi:nicotinate phosphoribosyltransferase